MSELIDVWPSPEQGWDPNLDGVVQAPCHHEVVYEDDHRRALYVSIEPGVTEPLHTHHMPSRMFVIAGAAIRYHNHVDGTSFDIPARDVSPARPFIHDLPPEGIHATENVDQSPYIALRIEYKIPPNPTIA